MSKIKDFIKLTFQHDIEEARRDIRAIKKHIRKLETIKSGVDNAKEDDLLNLVKSDQATIDMYEKYSKLMEDRERESIEKMVKSGKLKEIFYDRDGKEIEVGSEGSEELHSPNE